MSELFEKVEKGLACCKSRSTCNDECPYYHIMEDPNFGMDDCTSKLATDSFSLLKFQQARIAELEAAQMARVMTLEEVKAMKRYTICAVEQRSKVRHTTFNAEYRASLTIDGQDYLDFGLYADVNPFRRSEGGYGKTWRCWTKKPTDEQRKAVKWDA